MVALDAAARRVEFADGSTAAAEAIVLATGGRARRLPVPGGERATVLRTRTDAESLREKLVPGARVLIVGAGLIGGEVAATAAGRGCRVTLVDPNPLPMDGALGPQAARALHAQHTAHGVTVVCGGVQAMEPGAVRLSTGQCVPADVVVAGIGITLNTDLAAAAGLEVDNGVVVDAGMRTNAAGIYAIGDIARVVGSPHRSEHWDNARRTAEVAARSILGLAPAPPRAPWFWTDRYGAHLEMTGLYDPEAQAVPRGDIEAGEGTVFYVRGARCVGAVSLQRPLDIRAAQRMIDRDVHVDASRLADEATDLRKLITARE
jgi:NADPH-dependent 2,4-dienoyl-CoA reductase/sulfur reductase-like enzyme